MCVRVYAHACEYKRACVSVSVHMCACMLVCVCCGAVLRQRW